MIVFSLLFMVLCSDAFALARERMKLRKMHYGIVKVGLFVIYVYYYRKNYYILIVICMYLNQFFFHAMSLYIRYTAYFLWTVYCVK